jgi:hypothetical protein
MLNLARMRHEDNIKVDSKAMGRRWGRVQWQDIIIACNPLLGNDREISNSTTTVTK